jgi:hypothetical protein
MFRFSPAVRRPRLTILRAMTASMSSSQSVSAYAELFGYSDMVLRDNDSALALSGEDDDGT